MKRAAPRRKKVAADELTWMIDKDLREVLGKNMGSCFAVVPDPKNGWRAVQLSRMRKNPELAVAITKIERVAASVHFGVSQASTSCGPEDLTTITTP